MTLKRKKRRKCNKIDATNGLMNTEFVNDTNKCLTESLKLVPGPPSTWTCLISCEPFEIVVCKETEIFYMDGTGKVKKWRKVNIPSDDLTRHHFQVTESNTITWFKIHLGDSTANVQHWTAPAFRSLFS